MGQQIDIPIDENGAIKADIKDALADGNIFIGDSDGVTSEVAMSGDATIANTGAVTIAADAVTTAKILDGAVTSAKLADPTLHVLEQAVAVADFDDSGTNAVGFIDLLTDLPAGAIVTRVGLSALTGFAGDTSATIQIGDGSTADRYSTGTPDVFTTAAFVDAGVVSGTAYDLAAVTPRVTITSDSDFTSVVTDANGAITISIFYYTV